MKKITATIGCLVLTMSGFAQDNHHEALQLGAKNSILSGGAVSKWLDPTAVFQNPATLTQSLANTISFNTAAFNLNNINFVNGLGKGYTLKSSTTGFLPALVGGSWRPKNKITDWVLGYAIYHRNRDKIRFNSRAESSANVVNDVESPGNENYIAQYSLDTEFDETAGVLGIGKKLNDKWSFGASFNAVFRNRTYREVFSANVITDPANNPKIDIVSSSSDISVNYNKALAQLKLGLAYENKSWNVGFTIMTPSVGIFGKGEIVADINLTNIKLPQNTTRKNYLASARLVKLKPTLNHPLSVALGATKKFSKIQLSAAAIWHAPIKKYVLLDPGNAVFIRPANSQNVLATKDFLQVWAVNRSVVNASFSADWILKPSLHLLLGYALDQNFSEDLPDEPGFQLSKKLWNLNHINAGVQLVRPKAEWIFGVQTAFAKKDDYRQPYSFDGPTEDNFLQGKRTTGTIKSSSIGLIISYSFKIGK